MEYAENVRARMVRRMLGPHAATATSLSQETGIPQPTLSRWLRTAASIKTVSSPKPPSPPPTETQRRQLQDWTALGAQAVLPRASSARRSWVSLRCQGRIAAVDEWKVAPRRR
jgi:transposase-like protein